MRRACLLLAVVVSGGCRPSTLGSYPEAPIVVVSIDTLRADHLPLYGYRSGATPHLDALGREAVVFEDAYSHCPLTLPSHASLFTGLLPPQHGVRDNVGFRLAEERPTLASLLRAAGWRTGGAVSAFVLRAETGVAQGFEFYEDALTTPGGEQSLGSLQRDGRVAVEALSGWLGQRPQARSFAFLHLYEPHSPYRPPAHHAAHTLAYDGEIAYADELLGHFLESLKAHELYERALIVVTSDHGEGLRDHGELEHGLFLYREAVHVPLLLRLPGAARGGSRVRGAVGLADVAPTLLDLVGQPRSGMHGVSLRLALEAGQSEGRPVYSETLYPRYHFGWNELYAASGARYRYIRAPRPELYDLEDDPKETRNVLLARGAAAAELTAWLEPLVTQAELNAPEPVPDDVREKLQALGYLGGGATAASQAEGPLPDPKDKVAVYEQLQRAIALRRDERDAEAAEQFRSVLAENPGLFDAWEMLGGTLLRLDRTPEAIAAFGKAIELDPTQPGPHLSLAKLYALEGRSALALEHAELASRREPGKGQELLAQQMLNQRQWGRAADFARRSLAADSRRVMSHFVLGVVAQQAGRCDEALGHFRRAEQAKRLQQGFTVLGLHANMADCLARLGREAEAEREFRAEIDAIPWSPQGRVGLAMLYRSQGRDAEARATLAGLVNSQPRPSAETYWTVVRTFSLLGDADAAREWALQARARFPSDPRFR